MLTTITSQGKSDSASVPTRGCRHSGSKDCVMCRCIVVPKPQHTTVMLVLLKSIVRCQFSVFTGPGSCLALLCPLRHLSRPQPTEESPLKPLKHYLHFKTEKSHLHPQNPVSERRPPCNHETCTATIIARIHHPLSATRLQFSTLLHRTKALQ